VTCPCTLLEWRLRSVKIKAGLCGLMRGSVESHGHAVKDGVWSREGRHHVRRTIPMPYSRHVQKAGAAMKGQANGPGFSAVSVSPLSVSTFRA